MTSATAKDLLYGFDDGGPLGEVPIGTAIERLLKLHSPAHAAHAMYLLLDERLVDWRSHEGKLTVAADGHYYTVAQRVCEEQRIDSPWRSIRPDWRRAVVNLVADHQGGPIAVPAPSNGTEADWLKRVMAASEIESWTETR